MITKKIGRLLVGVDASSEELYSMTEKNGNIEQKFLFNVAVLHDLISNKKSLMVVILRYKFNFLII